MKKGQIFEGIIERVDFPNKGLVKVEEEGKDARYVTVKNAVPGQKVRFIINKFKKGNAEGRLLEVLENSSLKSAMSLDHRIIFQGSLDSIFFLFRALWNSCIF